MRITRRHRAETNIERSILPSRYETWQLSNCQLGSVWLAVVDAARVSIFSDFFIGPLRCIFVLQIVRVQRGEKTPVPV